MAVPQRPASPDYRPTEVEGATVQEPTPNARQGATHQGVRYVLAISTGVLIVIFGIVYLVYFGI